MNVYKLVKKVGNNGMLDLVGLRFEYPMSESDTYLDWVVKQGDLVKGVAYDISIDEAKRVGLIHSLMSYNIGTIYVDSDGFKKGKRLNDPMLQRHIAKLLDYDYIEYAKTSNDFKSWLTIMAKKGEFKVLSKPVKEQVNLYKIACSTFSSKRAKSVELEDGTKAKFKYFTYKDIYEEAGKYKNGRGTELSGALLRTLLHYLVLYRGYLVVGDCNLTNDTFASWYKDAKLRVKNDSISVKEHIAIGMLYK